MMPHAPPKRAGFSLVELSIVLVILGLLTGGILAGQSLIRAAELRAVSSEATKHHTAILAFRDKYFALPGDMTNAISFWGAAHATPATCVTTQGTGTQTCNGDGNGRTDEYFRLWQHLANAGLIEGNYTGIATGGTAVIGTNVPASKLAPAGWAFAYHTPSGWLSWQRNQADNWLFFGSYYATNLPINAAVKPEEAWNIDTKMDDGMAATGRVIGGAGYALGTGCTTGAGAAAIYALSTNSITCGMAFLFN